MADTRYTFIASASAFRDLYRQLGDMLMQPGPGELTIAAQSGEFAAEVKTFTAVQDHVVTVDTLEPHAVRTSFMTDDFDVAFELVNLFFCEDRFFELYADGVRVTTHPEDLVSTPWLLADASI